MLLLHNVTVNFYVDMFLQRLDVNCDSIMWCYTGAVLSVTMDFSRTGSNLYIVSSDPL